MNNSNDLLFSLAVDLNDWEFPKKKFHCEHLQKEKVTDPPRLLETHESLVVATSSPILNKYDQLSNEERFLRFIVNRFLVVR